MWGWKSRPVHPVADDHTCPDCHGAIARHQLTCRHCGYEVVRRTKVDAVFRGPA